MANLNVTTEGISAAQSIRMPDDWGEAVFILAVLSAEVKFEKLTVKVLSGLEPGSILRTFHAAGSPVLVSVAGQFIGWAEFQVVGPRLALRMADME